MEVKCRYDALIPVGDLTPYPRNRNRHTKAQVDRLAKLLKYQGVRAPIIVSTLSKCIVKGHGTLMAIKKNKWKEAPVVYQDFDNEDQEYAFVQSDNAISEWASLDLAAINLDIPNFDPSFDIDNLGLRDFVIEPSEKNSGTDGTSLSMADKFMLPPFTVLNAREGWWQDRKRQWVSLGIKSELGRGEIIEESQEARSKKQEARSKKQEARRK